MTSTSLDANVGNDGSRQIVIITTEDERDTVEKHKLSLRDYMNAMARSDFFICPPGWVMPHSHNLIEAMSVGTIPITNYHTYMRPSLTANENCLAFSTLDELEMAVNRALRMAKAEISRLRAGVISYYDEHLDPTSFGAKLVDRSISISEVVVNDESGR